MQSDVELAVEHAMSVARSRGGRLLRVTFGGDVALHVFERVRRAFHARGAPTVEVNILPRDHPLRVLSVEVSTPAAPPT